MEFFKSEDTIVFSAYQCAEIERIAFGRGSLLPSAFQVLEKSSSSIADMGEPWPTKIIGINVLFIEKDYAPLG
jgi:hypothetical protein